MMYSELNPTSHNDRDVYTLLHSAYITSSCLLISLQTTCRNYAEII